MSLKTLYSELNQNQKDLCEMIVRADYPHKMVDRVLTEYEHEPNPTLHAIHVALQGDDGTGRTSKNVHGHKAVQLIVATLYQDLQQGLKVVQVLPEEEKVRIVHYLCVSYHKELPHPRDIILKAIPRIVSMIQYHKNESVRRAFFKSVLFSGNYAGYKQRDGIMKIYVVLCELDYHEEVIRLVDSLYLNSTCHFGIFETMVASQSQPFLDAFIAFLGLGRTDTSIEHIAHVGVMLDRWAMQYDRDDHRAWHYTTVSKITEANPVTKLAVAIADYRHWEDIAHIFHSVYLVNNNALGYLAQDLANYYPEKWDVFIKSLNVMHETWRHLIGYCHYGREVVAGIKVAAAIEE